MGCIHLSHEHHHSWHSPGLWHSLDLVQKSLCHFDKLQKIGPEDKNTRAFFKAYITQILSPFFQCKGRSQQKKPDVPNPRKARISALEYTYPAGVEERSASLDDPFLCALSDVWVRRLCPLRGKDCTKTAKNDQCSNTAAVSGWHSRTFLSKRSTWQGHRLYIKSSRETRADFCKSP